MRPAFARPAWRTAGIITNRRWNCWTAASPCWARNPYRTRSRRPGRWSRSARERGLRYGINLNHRFTPAALRAKEWVEAGRLGVLNIINMTMWINNPNESSPHFHMRALHPHSIDVMRYFCGDVEKVQAFFKKGRGRKIWSKRPGQHAVRKRRRRPPDRKLRRRRKLWPGDLRGRGGGCSVRPARGLRAAGILSQAFQGSGNPTNTWAA